MMDLTEASIEAFTTATRRGQYEFDEDGKPTENSIQKGFGHLVEETNEVVGAYFPKKKMPLDAELNLKEFSPDEYHEVWQDSLQSEFADVIINVLSLSRALGIENLEDHVRAKMMYNRFRKD